MKKIKQATAVLLSLVLVVSLLQMWTGTNEKVKAAGYGISNPTTDSNGVTTWDCIYFGNYCQSSEKTKEPIKWRVLSVDGDDAFLLADQNLDCQPYNETYTDVTWETCTLRTWLNDVFCNTAFNAAEQAAIKTTTVVNDENPFYGTSGGNNTQDKIYLLSLAEASDSSYGFDSEIMANSNTRVSTNTAHLKVVNSSMYSAGSADWWWLRSSGYPLSNASQVSDSGYGYGIGREVNYSAYAVRPVLHLNLNNLSDNTLSLWSKAGQVASEDDNTVPDVSMTPTEEPSVTESPKPTEEPCITESPNPTEEPSVTESPNPIETPGGTENPSTSTPPNDKHDQNVQVNIPTNNTRLNDSKGTVYTVTRAGRTNGEVSYTSPKNKKVTSVTIPATVKLKGITYKVTSVRAKALQNSKKLKKVVIGKNIKTIGKNAFYGCTNLKNVTIKTTKLTVKTVGSNAFSKINKKAVIKVPKSKLSAYKKLLKKKGAKGLKIH